MSETYSELCLAAAKLDWGHVRALLEEGAQPEGTVPDWDYEAKTASDPTKPKSFKSHVWSHYRLDRGELDISAENQAKQSWLQRTLTPLARVAFKAMAGKSNDDLTWIAERIDIADLTVAPD